MVEVSSSPTRSISTRVSAVSSLETINSPCRSCKVVSCCLARFFTSAISARISARLCSALDVSSCCVCMCVCVSLLYVCIYVCMHVCIYVCMHVFMYVCMYVCIHVCMFVCIYACMCVCMYVRTYVCVCVCMYVCMHVRMHVWPVCMYVCQQSKFQGQGWIILQRVLVLRISMWHIAKFVRAYVSENESMSWPTWSFCDRLTFASQNARA